MEHPILIFFAFLSLVERFQVEGQTNSIFDPTEGSRRTGASCTPKLPPLYEDDRKAQANLPGGVSAIIGSNCNHAQWKDVREKFLQDAWDRKYDNFNAYLENQRAVSLGRPLNYFEDLCIACVDEPMLECDAGTGKCTCWRHYVKEISTGSETIRCRIKLGDFCTVNSLYTGCVKQAYCDKDAQLCTCTTQPGAKCSDASALELPSAILLAAIVSSLKLLSTFL